MSTCCEPRLNNNASHESLINPSKTKSRVHRADGVRPGHQAARCAGMGRLAQNSNRSGPGVASLGLCCRLLLTDAAKSAFQIGELRQNAAIVLLRRRQGEPHALRGRFLVELLDIGNGEAQLDSPCRVLLRRRMQGKRRFPGHEFAPLRGLELQLEAEHVAVELHRAVHVANKLNNVGEFHFGSPLADSTTAKNPECNGVASLAAAKSCLPIRHSDSYAEPCLGRATPQK